MHAISLFLTLYAKTLGGGPPPAPLDAITLSASRMLAKERLVGVDGGIEIFANNDG